MTRLKHIFLLVTLVMIVCAPLSVSAEIIDRIVARVNEDVVTLNDVRRAAIPFMLQKGQNPAVLQNPAQREGVLRSALEDLIDRKLIVQEAAKIDYKISEKDLKQWLAYNAQQRNVDEAQFQQIIEQLGVPWKDYKEIARQNLLRMAMIRIKVGSQVTITEADVEAKYRAKFGDTPDKDRYRTIQHILMRPEADTPEAKQKVVDALHALRARLDAGESFEDIAKVASQGPSASKGGVIGSFKQGELDPNFESVAFALKIGTVSEPVETRFGIHIIRVLDEEMRAGADVDQRRDMIRAQIQQEEMDRLLKQYVSELRTKAFVEVSY